jgi:hypothetical protein
MNKLIGIFDELDVVEFESENNKSIHESALYELGYRLEKKPEYISSPEISESLDYDFKEFLKKLEGKTIKNIEVFNNHFRAEVY